MDLELFANIYKVLSELVGEGNVRTIATVIFLLWGVSIAMIPVTIVFACFQLVDLIGLPVRCKEYQNKKEHVSTWQTVKSWFPKKKSEVQES